jgi:hypothetical protein
MGYGTPDDVLRIDLADQSLQFLQLGLEVAGSPGVVGALSCRVVVAVFAPLDVKIQDGSQSVVGTNVDDQRLNPVVSTVAQIL